jgi:hypothetical protein
LCSLTDPDQTRLKQQPYLSQYAHIHDSKSVLADAGEFH